MFGAVVFTLLQTPLYEASTRLFVSASSGSSATEVFQGMRYSQERVISYTQLLTGETLAQRTIDRLDLDMDPAELTEQITAKAIPDTVLIDLAVLDESPVRARDIANAVSEEFVEMARELETPAAGARPDARVVVEQRATIPAKPVIPKRIRNLAAGLALGLTLGLSLATLRELLDNTVKSEQTVQELTGAGVVGSIPFDKKVLEFASISFEIDNSGIAEAFRKLRTNMQFLAVDNPPRVIAVTSSAPAEGKSTTSINLALALAEAEHNVVLVDADLRRPRLAKYLELVGSVGFSTVLSGGASLADVLQSTKFPRLTVLAAGSIPPNPSELLGSVAATKLISDLRSQFDFVIIDTSPLLAVTDAAVISVVVDGVLVAVRAGKTKRDQLAHSIGMLKDVNAKILGTVLTMVPTRGSGAYSYNYYSYGYGDAKQGQNGSDRLIQARAPKTNL
jgi:receptor protein-tyrosine kinase